MIIFSQSSIRVFSPKSLFSLNTIPTTIHKIQVFVEITLIPATASSEPPPHPAPRLRPIPVARAREAICNPILKDRNGAVTCGAVSTVLPGTLKYRDPFLVDYAVASGSEAVTPLKKRLRPLRRGTKKVRGNSRTGRERAIRLT